MQFSKITLSLLLALPTAFAAISLGDTESLNKDEVTLGCLNTYNREVKECSKTEISSGSCSSGCATALNTLGKDVMLACRQAYAGPDTLLRKIIDGGLVVTLCKSTDNGSTEGKDEETSSTSAPAKDQATTTTTSAPEETSTDASETVTSETEQPTGAANTESSNSTDASVTETSSETKTSNATKTPGSEDSILGNDNAAGRFGVGMGVILGAVIAGAASML